MRKKSRLRDDRGIAMVTTILVMVTVAILSITALSLSSHDLNGSGLDRSRIQSVSAAEAGLDQFYLIVEQTPSSFLPCGTPLTNQALAIAPTARYTVSVRYYATESDAASDVAMPCAVHPSATPMSMKVTSVGTEAKSTRTMESFVRLRQGIGGTFGSDAVYAQTTADFKGNTTVNGSAPGVPDGDVFSNDTLTIGGAGGAGGTIWGNVRTQKNLVMDGHAEVRRDIFAKLDVVIRGGSVAWGTVNSSTSTITVSGSGSLIKGDANACTGVIPHDHSFVVGTWQDSACPAPPPSRTFDYYTYDPSNWPGYTINTYSGATACPDATTWITTHLVSPATPPTTNYVIRITDPPCLLQFNNTLMKVRGDLAIISNGGVTLNGSSTFQSFDATRHKFALMTGIGSRVPCTNYGISIKGGNYTNLDVLFYTPCNVQNTAGNFVATGQIYAGSVNFNGTAALTFKGFLIPGLGIGYYSQDIAYIREVK